MIYVHTYPYRIMADEAFAAFVRSERITRASKNGSECIAITDNDEHHFMTEERYYRWRLGRTYEMDGVIYHSDSRLPERSK